MRRHLPIALIVALVPAAALVTLLASPARADVIGPACVTDGDTLVVNGKRQRTRCVGGTRVRLFGIDAPELKQMCKHATALDGAAPDVLKEEAISGRLMGYRNPKSLWLVDRKRRSSYV